MPTLIAIQTRLAQLAQSTEDSIIKSVIQLLISQKYCAQLSAETVQNYCRQYALTPITLALTCLPIAACYARVPVSNFYVGAIAIGKSGTFYFGANQEFAQEAMQQTVHAEQSAVSHAWLAGEEALSDMVVNYTPCGHCRQFMNELNSAPQLKIHLPHSQNNLLHSYLPDAFGPKDLNVEKVLFDPQQHTVPTETDPLVRAAMEACSHSYAPYSQAISGVALQVGERIIQGRYAENAAFNPSFLPLQSALNYRRLQGLEDVAVSRIVLAERKAVLSHLNITAALAKTVLGLEPEYFSF